MDVHTVLSMENYYRNRPHARHKQIKIGLRGTDSDYIATDKWQAFTVTMMNIQVPEWHGI
jgi:hypothetical protein